MKIHRIVTAVSVITVLLLAFAALFTPTSSSTAAQGDTSAAVAMEASESALALRQAEVADTVAHRFIYPKGDMDPDKPGPNPTFARDANSNLITINEPVQTFDLLSPPPDFNSPDNAFAAPIAPTTSAPFINKEPCWTKDDEFIVFASNAPSQAAADITAKTQNNGSFHLWIAPASGGTPVQLTSGSGSEDFPVLSPTNNYIAFRSTISGTTNIIEMPFSETPATPMDISQFGDNPGTVGAAYISVTALNGSNSKVRGFTTVGRPAWSAAEDRIAFAGLATTSAYADGSGHYHIFFLYVATGGFEPLSEWNGPGLPAPGKLTDGPEDDLDPAWSPDGQFIAFSSNAAGFQTTSNLPNQGEPPIYPNPGGAVPTPGVANSGENTPSICLDQTFNQVPANETPGELSTNGQTAIFMIAENGTTPAANGSSKPNGQVTVPPTGDNDGEPSWAFANSEIPGDESASYDANLGVTPYNGFLAFERSKAAGHNNIDYLLADDSYTDVTDGQQITKIVSEGLTVTDAYNTYVNFANQLNTSDTASGSLIPYDNEYPAWSPLVSHVDIVYQSDRSLTYNDSTGAPSETPFNYTPGMTGQPSSSSSSSYVGVLESEVANLNPPTILRYVPGAGEVVHINAGQYMVPATPANPSGSATRYIEPGQKVWFTVRLSDRETGVDGNNVFIQIKNPNSAYDDSQTMEHKCFATDNPPSTIVSAANDTDNIEGYYDNYNSNDQTNPIYVNSLLYSGLAGSSPFCTPTNFDECVGVFAVTPPNPPQYWPVHGSIGGQDDAKNLWGVGQTIDPNTGLAKKLPPAPSEGNGYTDSNHLSLFRSWGPEYECQAIKFPYSGYTTNGLTTATDFYRPFYLAGWDDLTAHSAPGQNSPIDIALNHNVIPLTWIPLHEAGSQPGDVPSGTNPQDNNGGTLYTVSWNVPNNPSDYYIDVIAYDNANVTTVNQPGGQPQTTEELNRRIYDNVWGFTSQQFTGGHNILVVSDYTLGQKFAASEFNGPTNLRATMYGTESYYTGVWQNDLPNALYVGHLPVPGTIKVPSIFPITGDPCWGGSEAGYGCFASVYYPEYQLPGQYPGVNPYPVLNALGPYSYFDQYTGGDGTNANPGPEQMYDIWRTLSRGPVDQSVLMSYAPTPEVQPAVADPDGFTQPAATFMNATKCVVWATPYTGDLLFGPGTFESPTTQTQLTTFLAAGGRLFVSGQDVADTLTAGGSANNDFTTSADLLPNLYGAVWQGTTQASNVIKGATVAGSRISEDAMFNAASEGNPSDYTMDDWYVLTSTLAGGPIIYQPPAIYTDILSNIINFDQVIGAWQLNSRSDAAMDEFMNNTYTPNIPLARGGLPKNYFDEVQGRVDVINAVPANNGATAVPNQNNIAVHTDYSLVVPTGAPAGAGLIYYENPGAGSRVVYSSFGLEGMSNDYFNAKGVGNPPPLYFSSHNLRPMVMHNIVTYLRSGSLTGSVYQNSGTGATLAVPAATVYVLPAAGTTIPSGMPTGRTAYSGTTNSAGQYTIDGIDTGSYNVLAYKPGFTRAQSTVKFTCYADFVQSESLNINPVPSGNLSGNVTDGTNGLEGVTVSFTTLDGTVTVSAVTDVQGNYTIQNVPASSSPGEPYTATATLNGALGTLVAPTTNPVYVQPGASTSGIDFTLSPKPTEITGVVEDATTTQGIGGATVTAIAQDGSNTTYQATTSNGPTTANGDAALGSFTFTGVNGQGGVQYAITVSAAGYEPSNAVTVTANEGQTATVPAILLTPGVPITLGGLVQGASGGTPIGGLTVNVTDSNGNLVTAFTTTNTTQLLSDNVTQINYHGQVAPGKYKLTISGTTVSENVTVPLPVGSPGVGLTYNGGPFALATALTMPSVVVSGTVSQGVYTGNVTGATVTVSNAASSAVVGSAVTNAGNYKIEFAAIAGTYNVTVEAPGQSIPSPATVTNLSANPITTGSAPGVVSVTAATSQTVDLNFNISVAFSFPTGEYLFSMPTSYPSVGWNQLFGTIPTQRSDVAVWQPTVGQYAVEPALPANVPAIGLGFWIKVTDSGTDITSFGVAPTLPTVPITLNPGWNQIGVPSNIPISLTSIQFANPGGGNPISWQYAIGSGYNIVNPTLYGYCYGLKNPKGQGNYYYATPPLVTVTGANGGNFTLSFGGQTTALIAFNATASTVQTALQALSSIGAGNAVVTGPAGGPYVVLLPDTITGTLTASAGNPSTTGLSSSIGGTPTVSVGVAGLQPWSGYWIYAYQTATIMLPTQSAQ